MDFKYEWEEGTPIFAIDVGTSRTAMTSTVVGKEKLLQELLYPVGCESEKSRQEKIATAILLSPNQNFDGNTPIRNPSDVDIIAFGEEAERRYSSSGSDLGYIFLKWFKMELHTSNINPNPELRASPNVPSVLLSVALAKTIEFFKDRAMDYLRSSISEDSTPYEAVWILTVPAIWNDAAKRMMRRAAYAAGLIDSVESSRLVLCLEPEGVSFTGLYGSPYSALHSSMNEFVTAGERESEPPLMKILSKVGEKYVVLDAGGGTVDLASYEVMSTAPFRVKQLAAPTGGPYGSTQVDKVFMNFIRDLIGPEATEELDRRKDVEWSILKRWEAVKVNITLNERDVTEILPARIQLDELQREILEKTSAVTGMDARLPELVQMYNTEHEDMCVEAIGDTRVSLPSALLTSFFEPSIELIRKLLKKYITSTPAKEARHLIMAGGYVQCPVLWQAVKTEFESEYATDMLMVTRPDTAIVRGAAIYGTAHRQLVSHRVSPLTYGTRVLIRYNPRLYPEHVAMKKYIESDQERAEWIPAFDIHVHAGDELPVNFVSSRRKSWPLLDTQNTSTRKVLATSNPTVSFSNESGVSVIGEFNTPVDMSVPFRERSSQTEIEFGGVELVCRCYNGVSGELIGSYTADIA